MPAEPTPLLEVVGRVVVIYLALLVMMRVAGKREIGSLAPMDFLAILLLSETVSPALTRQDTSLAASLTAAGTLLGLTTLVSWFSYRFRWIERLIDGPPRVVIRDGHVDDEVCRAERLTAQDLASALRKEGIVSPSDVACATVEPTGRITVIRREAAR
jgi:uncharacterized membrane protein YcaP (DUF421 family)